VNRTFLVFALPGQGYSQGTPSIAERRCDLLINIPLYKSSMEDDGLIRKAALMAQIPYTTTLPATRTVFAAIRTVKQGKVEVSLFCVTCKSVASSPSPPLQAIMRENALPLYLATALGQ
jgi:hypothetical protein